MKPGAHKPPTPQAVRDMNLQRRCPPPVAWAGWHGNMNATGYVDTPLVKMIFGPPVLQGP